MNEKVFLTKIKRGLGLDKKYNKEKEDVISKAEKEAEEIFMKTQPGWEGNKNYYPKVKSDKNNDQGTFSGFTKKGRGEMYGNRSDNVDKQVKDVRLKQFKNKKKEELKKASK